MKKISKLQTIKNKFHWIDNEPQLNSYGLYRMGLLNEEIDYYLMARGNTLAVKRLRNKFGDIAGCNTMACTPDGKGLMYRHDVQRFADVLFRKTNSTYFD